MKMTKDIYGKMAKQASPPSTFVKNSVMAFLFGGAICTIGQGILEGYLMLGMDVKNARAAVSITLIGLAAILTAFKVFQHFNLLASRKVYDNIAKIAGAGTLVPITGFSNSIVSPAMEFKSEGYVLGLSAKMFIIAGPVLVYGIISSIIYGIVLYIISLF